MVFKHYTIFSLFIRLQTCDTGHSKLPSLKNSTSQSNAGLSFVFHLPHCSSDHALLLVVDAINHMFSLTEEPVKGVRYWVKNLWPVYLAILSCLEGPIPYLELFWVGSFEKNALYLIGETDYNAYDSSSYSSHQVVKGREITVKWKEEGMWTCKDPSCGKSNFDIQVECVRCKLKRK